MSVKPLWTAQAVADDQASVYSTLYNLLALWGIGSDELEDYEITAFGANKFLITIIFTISMMMLSASIVMKATNLERMVNLSNSKTIELILTPTLSNIVKYKMTKVSQALFSASDAARSRGIVKSITSRILGTMAQLSSDLTQARIVTAKALGATSNFKAWYNTVEVEQE